MFRGHSYFWNTKTREVSWYPPPGCKYFVGVERCFQGRKDY